MSVGFDGLKYTAWSSTLCTGSETPSATFLCFKAYCVSVGRTAVFHVSPTVDRLLFKPVCLSLCFVTWVAHMVVLRRGKSGLKTPKRNKYWPVLLLKVDTHSLICPHHKRLGKNSKMTTQIQNANTSGPCHSERKRAGVTQRLVPLCGQHLWICSHLQPSWTLGTSSCGCCSSKAQCAAFSTDPLIQKQMLWSRGRGTKRILWVTLSLSFEMMKPVRWVELKLVGLTDRQLRLVFGQVPQNICLYFLRTKPDIWVHLTYREACSFLIWLTLTNLGMSSVLWKKLMEKNGLLGSEYGHFITVKCPLCGTDGYKKTRGFCYSRVRLEREEVILAGCHWRAALASHKSLSLLRPDEPAIKRKWNSHERWGVAVSA